MNLVLPPIFSSSPLVLLFFDTFIVVWYGCFPQCFLFLVKSIFLCLFERQIHSAICERNIQSEEDREAQLQWACYDKLSLTPLRLWKVPAHPLYTCLSASFPVLLFSHASFLMQRRRHNVHLCTQAQILIGFLCVCKYTHQHELLWDLDWWDRQKAFALWIFHISIGLIPPACILTQQMGGEIWSGLSVSLWGNSAISFSLSLCLLLSSRRSRSLCSCVSNYISPLQPPVMIRIHTILNSQLSE